MSLLLLASRLWILLYIAVAGVLSVSAGLFAIADVPGVNNGVIGVSAVPFEHAVAGGPAVTDFPAVEGVLVVACVHADLL